MIGLEFRDRMHGSWHRLSAPTDERPIEFELLARVPHVTHLLGDTVAQLSGSITADGLASRVDAEGTMQLGAILRERRIPYRLDFTGDDGRRYRFDGAKELDVLDLRQSFTSLGAYLFDDTGEEIGRAVLRFDLRADLLEMIRSWRPVRT